MKFPLPFGFCFGLALFAQVGSAVATPPESEVTALLQQYCVECHQAEAAKAGLDLTSFDLTAPSAVQAAWLERIADVLDFEEMPPADRPQPSPAQREQLRDWMLAKLTALENANPADPGHRIMARLNQSEYNHVIRDLTGFDLQPARFFAADQEGHNGYINVGEVLGIEPVRIQNYLMAAKWVLHHAVATPHRGLVWYPEPIDVEGEENLQMHYLQELSEWHKRWEAIAMDDPWSPVHPDYVPSTEEEPGVAEQRRKLWNFAEYFFVAWQYHHRIELGMEEATFETLGASPYYRPWIAANWYERLLATEQPTELATRFVDLWQAIPGPGEIDSVEARERCETVATYLEHSLQPHHWFDHHGLRRRGQVRIEQIQPAFETSQAFEPIGGRFGTQREVGFTEPSLDIRERARYRAELDLARFPGETLYLVITDYWDGPRGDIVHLRDLAWEIDGEWQPFTLPTGSDYQAPITLEIPIPEKATRARFTAQLKNAHRDVATVQVMPLNRPPDAFEQRFLPGRQLIAWPERFGIRPKRRQAEVIWLEPLVTRLGNPGNRDTGFQNYLLADDGLSEEEWQRLGMSDGFETTSPYAIYGQELIRSVPPEAAEERARIVADLRWLLQGGAAHDVDAMAKAESRARDILSALLPRLWRRPVPAEAADFYLTEFRRALADGAGFDEAVKRPITMALVSPQFLFKNEAPASTADAVRQLDDFELANRLAFFLWSSMPDDRLFRLAAEGRLRHPDVLVAEARRMLEDEKARALAIEMTGRWLGFFQFDQFDQPDMVTFPEYTESLRAAMYEESIRFFTDFFRENRSIRDMVAAPYLYANAELASHYGLDAVEGDQVRLVELTPRQQEQRGGIFGMGSLLTLTSAPVRTSPIHRGVWLIDTVLGTPTPEPPPGIEALSEGEKSQDGLTIREQLAQHREDPACSSCHDRIDPPGLALESFDAIGRWRTHDRDGAPIESHGTLQDGTVLEGLPGLRRYVHDRLPDLQEQFLRKLTSFALGRYLTIHDRPLIREMMAAMEADNGRPMIAIELLIRSPQFQKRREANPQLQLGKVDHHAQ